MRRTAGLAAAALVVASLSAAATAGAASPSTTRQADPAGDLAAAAIAAVKAHPGAAKVGDAQGFRVTDALVDADGTSHVRMDRTYHGLRVLGGDLVVHRAADGDWKGVSADPGHGHAARRLAEGDPRPRPSNVPSRRAR